MKKKLLFSLILMVVFYSGFAQKLWNETSQERLSSVSKFDRASNPLEYKLYSLDYTTIKEQMATAPSRDSGLTSNVIVQFPNPNGEMESFRIYEASVMEPELAAKFPDIKSYLGTGIEDGTSNIRISTTVFGLHAMVLSGKRETSYIDTYTKDLNNYIVYNKSKLRTSRTWSCLVEDSVDEAESGRRSIDSGLASDGLFRTYRLAMACTIEYAAYHITAAGIPNVAPLATKKAAVLSAMNVTMTRLNGVYERDMSLRMQLVANNDAIIYVTSDSFTNDDAEALITQSQTVINSIIGNANYDIGHTVSTGGGGLAQSPSVCFSGTKAMGITGSPAPVGDAFDIDFVAHEIGHQFGASHTFNGLGGNCTATTRSDAQAVEPGSGTTIMAYAGICSGVDVQPNSDDHFHAVSIAQMVSHITGSGNCVTGVSNSNSAPVIAALPNYTIPFGTAFILKGNATDPNGDSLTYCWEQTNNNISTQPPVATSTTGPNFRSFSPSTSPNRYMPQFESVLAGNLTPDWEVVPNVARTMNFALTVRDNRTPNGGQTSRGNTIVTFAGVGPFRVTNPDVVNTSWDSGSTQNITWDVAGTTANGINTANVNILLSTDGGVTFGTVLAANTPNDGNQTITMPTVLAPYCRIMIESVGNIYYAVSKSFSLGYLVNTVVTCNNYTSSPATPIAAQTPIAWQILGQVSVPDSFTISDMNVSLNITHTRINDLYIGVLPPGATTTDQIRILYQQGCNALVTSNMITTFDDAGANLNCGGIAASNTYKPLNTLGFFNGANSAGNWRIVVADVAAANNGTLNNFTFNICSSVTTVTLSNEDFEINDFVIYPNPNNGNFNVQFNATSTNDINIRVHDMRGREVFTKSFQNNGLINENVNLENLQAGVYLVNVQDGNRKQVKKIIIE